MFAAIRNWVDARKRDLALRKLITNRRNDGAWSGFVPIGRDWFNYQSRTLLTGEGLRLVTSLYLVVECDEAQAFREECRLGTYPRLESAETTSSWATKTERATIRAFMRVGEREVLPYRVFAIEGSPEDLDGSLRDAIEALQRELRRKSARLLREERMSPTPRREPAEDAEDMFRYPGWDGVEPLDGYLARDSEEAFAADEYDEDQYGDLDEVDEDYFDDGEVRVPLLAVQQGPPSSPLGAAAWELLSTCHRYELNDSAFGDCEVHWFERPFDGDDDSQDYVAEGYLGRSGPSVSVRLPQEEDEVTFTGREALLLLNAGTLAGRSENSSLGAVD